MKDQINIADLPSALKLYTTREVAEILKMNVQVVSRKLQHGEISGFKIGKDWRVSENSLLAWLGKHSNQRRRGIKQKVLDSFVKNERILSLPAQRKKRRFVLEYILQNFRPRKIYTEEQVNTIISQFHDDFCTVRREFIMEKMMSRSGGKYRRNSSYKIQ
jgi:excisionase family DNA binding protein